MNTPSKRAFQLAGSVAALGIAAALVLPSRTEAFTTIGGSLGLSQRDFRVFNNFSDPTANDNVTPDVNFPGYVGVALAAWKGNIEWASRTHGNGNGDPHQPAGLGSGGADFDPSWQGYATGVGSENENIISELTGSDGGVLAFMEPGVGGISNGWRIRVYRDAAVWHDGPGGTPGGMQNFDLQAVLCHELGHALGLGHSADGNATMAPSIGPTQISTRSINADDIAGIQSIYSVATGGIKPIITSIAVIQGQVTINGSGFSASNNEVWFTQAGTGGTGEPVKATGLTSGGSSIVAPVPLAAGSGDILVKISGTGNDKLSNPWPFQIDNGPVCNPAFNTCFTSPNSVNPIGAVMGYGGTQSIANNDFILAASGCPPNASGLFYYGANETFSVFGNGFRCIGSPTFRLGIIQVNLFGDATLNLDYNTVPGGISAGQTKYFQFWYRNPAGGGAGFNLSDALGVPFCP